MKYKKKKQNKKLKKAFGCVPKVKKVSEGM